MDSPTAAPRPAAPACELFRRCLAGRRDEDWRELLRRYGRRLRTSARLAYGTRRPSADSLDELTQELLLRLLTLDPLAFRGHSEGELWAYLDRIAQNLQASLWRARRTYRRGGRQVSSSAERRGHCLVLPEARPEDAVIARDLLRVFLRHCRRGRRGELRVTVVRLAFVEGWNSREIARAFPDELTPAQVDSMIHRLRQHLGRRGRNLGRRPPFPPRPEGSPTDADDEPGEAFSHR